jgi:enoyl-CoA hydratase/carnithine racemase
MDLAAIDQLWRFFAQQEREPSAGIVLHAPPSVMGPDSVDDVLYGHGIGPDGHAIDPGLFEASDFVREMNALRRFIEAVRRVEAFVVVTLSGRMVLPLLGPALACDARIASEDFVLVNRILDYSFPPLGGLPWFLTQLVGRTQAEYLFQHEGSIDAKQALGLGLVDKIVPQENLVEAAVALAQDIANRPYGNREAIKLASVVGGESLDEYMLREEAVFKKSVAKLQVRPAVRKNRSAHGRRKEERQNDKGE